MEQLIWLSIPGAVIVLPIACLRPEIFARYSIVAVVVLPLIGFVFHQFFRLCFEMTGGFGRKSRTSLDYIQQNLGASEHAAGLSRQVVFMVWEITFYGDGFPEAFRDHDRGCWHYVLSFYSIALAALVVSVICVLAFVSGHTNLILVLLALVELVLGLVFFLKGKSTYNNLMEQEKHVFDRHKELFQKTVDSFHES